MKPGTVTFSIRQIPQAEGRGLVPRPRERGGPGADRPQAGADVEEPEHDPAADLLHARGRRPRRLHPLRHVRLLPGARPAIRDLPRGRRGSRRGEAALISPSFLSFARDLSKAICPSSSLLSFAVSRNDLCGFCLAPTRYVARTYVTLLAHSCMNSIEISSNDLRMPIIPAESYDLVKPSKG